MTAPRQGPGPSNGLLHIQSHHGHDSRAPAKTLHEAMYVNREEYLILAAYVGALAHLLTETGDCWNRAIGVRSSGV